jgi:L-asparaginase II
MRGDYIESEHRGQVVVSDAAGKIVRAWGSSDASTFLRSAAKPFQAIAAITSGADEKFGWSPPERAVVVSSHDASADHLTIVRDLLTKASLDESALRCGPHPPINSLTRESLLRDNQEARPIHNNCSGKHAGMLSACLAQDWPTDSYEKPDHPLQHTIAQTIARLASIPSERLPTAIDGCAVPTFYLPIGKIALLYARLADQHFPKDKDDRAASVVTQAMALHPNLVSWPGHLTDLLGKHLGTPIISKGGAEGVFGIGLPELGLGIAIKVADGSARVLPAVACRVLSLLLPNADTTSFERALNPPLRNTRQEIVGQIEPTID